MSKYFIRAGGFLFAFLCGFAAVYFVLLDRSFYFPVVRPNDVTVDYGPSKYVVENPNPGVQKTDLFVFVGEKIEVAAVPMPPGEMWFDARFNAKYRVIERVYGEFDGGLIEFEANDHYGYPPFARSTHALLFVSKIEGKLYHEKYQYYEVHRTKDGRWAGCGDPYLGMDYHRKPFIPKPLEFLEPVALSLKDFPKGFVETILVPPYFDVADGKATCKMGAYVDELFQIKRDGVLKARGVGQN